jgi:8-amino-7-oxononanoate synthase
LSDTDPRLEPTGWIMASPPGPEVILGGQSYLYFAGTGYLGLQADLRVIAAGQEGLKSFGVHTATTRAGYGSSPPVLDVERRTAKLLAADEACYLATGYACNFAVAAALSDEVDLVLVDESAHDCLREATRWLDRLASRPAVLRHCDPQNAHELLAARLRPGQRALVMTDGIFAASGRVAPIGEYLSVLDRFDGSMLLVDDAHGLAVLGENGRGTLEWAGVDPGRINRLQAPEGATRVFHTATLSKAVGGQGGAIAGSPEFMNRVRRSSGWYRGSSAPAAPVAAATAAALAIVECEPALRTRLAANVEAVRDGLSGLGLVVDRSPSPIVSFRLDTAAAMQEVHRRLLDEGIAVAYTRDYAGAGPAGVIRIAVFATHTP